MKGLVRIVATGALGAGAIGWARAARQNRALNFLGRSVVITGGTRGLGLLMARRLADEGALLTVFARDEGEVRRAEAELRGLNAEVLAFTADICNKQQAQGAIERAIERFGRIDVLINNAGIITAAPVEHMTDDDFEEALLTHMWGPLWTMQAAIPHMRAQGGGRIVNVASIGGRIAIPHLTPYCASKHALVGLSDGMRTELAKDHILVTTVAPGTIRTGSPPNTKQKGQHAKEYAWFAIADALPGVSKDAEDTARQIVEAARYGDPELTISTQARLLMIANAVTPSLTAHLLKLANRLLPAPSAAPDADQPRVGWENQSAAAPSVLTTLSDRATVANNELMGRDPSAIDQERSIGQ
jgi:NAD(P)-dependent dehydrogenase (short-subunit alcohol dehydrogenase family)